MARKPQVAEEIVDEDVGTYQCSHDIQNQRMRGKLVWRSEYCVNLVLVVQ